MKTYNKNTLIYKIRAWVIVLLGGLEIINMIASLIGTEDSLLARQILIWLLFMLFFTITEIYDDFVIVRLDGVVFQPMLFLSSSVFVAVVFSLRRAIIILAIELLIMMVGIIVIRHKHKMPTKRKKKA